MTAPRGADVVDSGPPPSRGGVAAVVTVAVLVVAGGLALRWSRDGAPSPAASAPPATGTQREPDAVPLLDPTTAAPPSPIPGLVVAPGDSAPRDSLLVVNGYFLFRDRQGDFGVRFDIDVAVPVPEALHVRGGSVLAHGAAPGTAGEVAFVATGGGVKPLGSAERVAPAVDPASVWLQTGDVARRVSLPGARELARAPLPPRSALMGEVPGGLLLSSVDEPRAAVVKGDEVVRRFDGRVVDVTPRHFVLLDESCTAPCVVVVDTGTWTPRTFHGYDADRPPVLSPDGSTLAGYAVALDGTARLVAYDVTSSSRVVVGRSAVAATTRTAAAWSRDSRTLYVALADGAGSRQVAVWRHRDNGSLALLPALTGTAVWPE